MALLKITVKMPMRAAGMVIEPGMSVQLATMIPNPVSHLQEREKVNNLFINNFGVDLKKMGALNVAYLKTERM
uniref:Uncharacterized protein n=1 Tax=Prevotella sp. GTC17260 TaxID=3236796 RepID=A0AB33JIQ2_9BACT